MAGRDATGNIGGRPHGPTTFHSPPRARPWRASSSWGGWAAQASPGAPRRCPARGQRAGRQRRPARPRSSPTGPCTSPGDPDPTDRHRRDDGGSLTTPDANRRRGLRGRGLGSPSWSPCLPLVVEATRARTAVHALLALV